MIIAEHCKRGEEGIYEPTLGWPEDCYVQWGEDGVVFSKDGSYSTAFFEAFPKVPNAFIRGEGKTIEEAERSAFKWFQAILSCDGHEFERRGRTDEYGYCKKCNLGMNGVFEPLTECFKCGEKTCYSQRGDDKRWVCKTCLGGMGDDELSEDQLETRRMMEQIAKRREAG